MMCPKCGNKKKEMILDSDNSLLSISEGKYLCVACDNCFTDEQIKLVLSRCSHPGAEEALNLTIKVMIDWCAEKNFKNDDEVRQYFAKRSPAEKKRISIDDYYNIKNIKTEPHLVGKEEVKFFYKFLTISILLELIDSFSARIDRDSAISYVTECGYGHLIKKP